MKKIITLLFLLAATALMAQEKTADGKTVSHTFYAIGNGGGPGNNTALTAMGNALKNESKNTTVLFLGNNASPGGFDKDNPLAVANINEQAAVVNGFAGNVVFIPGASDWENGAKGLKKQQEYITGLLNDKAFRPKDGCGLEKIKINSETDLLVLDSEWALMNWDKVPNLNDDCEIRTKNAFYAEVEHEIVKSEGKTVIIAVYHPIATYGKYGNTYAFGINPQQINNKYYRDFSDKLLTIAQRFRNVVFVSGHENNMQYIVQNDIPVIIAGSGKAAYGGGKGPNTKFSAEETGFSKITSYTDGSVSVQFYGESNSFSAPLYASEVIAPDIMKTLPDYHEKETPQYVYKSIYTEEELKHSGLFKSLWGKHYRKDYLTQIKVKSALLDTLYGGLKPVRKGGGHQTNSLRMEDSQGREYTIRNAKKSALRFIQYFLFKTQYLTPDVNDTYFIQVLQDYWTTANPYASLTIGDLADAIQVYHANPQLFYIPKQKALGVYNEDFGDDIYFIEEQANDGRGDVASFGHHDKIIGTDDLIEKLRRKDKVAINEDLYIRSRLFDNIIGDFDRHHDQWRWAEEKQEDGSLYYSPIPRDRDQAYADFDGFILGAITTLSPPLRFMQRYKGKYKSLRWFNDAGDDVDRLVLKNDTEADWVKQAQYIKANMTEEVVNSAFAKFPEGLDKEKQEQIRQALLGRIANIEQQSRDLYKYLRSFVMITGTDKDDWFVITRKPGGITNIKGYRIQQGIKGIPFWDVDYNSAVTKEIWLYGLDDADKFEIVGEGDHEVCIKIIGGKNNDIYHAENKSKIKVYDQKSKPNTFETPVKKTLTDSYDLNTYDFMKGRKDISQILPMLGYNPDDGLGIGAAYSYTKNDLRRNPFTAKHNIKAMYFTATSGINASYAGEFAHIFNNVNLGIKAGYTSPYYTNNFFGLGNDTENNTDLPMDYYRVRIRNAYFAPSLIYRGYYGSIISFGLQYENIEVTDNEDRFINTAGVNPNVFDEQVFYSAEASYAYNNFDNAALPKKGFGFSLTGGYKANFDEDKGFAYIIPELRLTSKIDRGGILVLATKLKAKHIFNNDFEFYQAATIGDMDGLRGFRQQRFSGKTAYYQNTDLRLSLGKLSNGFIPVTWGLYGGFDYGRVWIDGENSNTWHTSQGGGLLFNIAGFTTANVAYFNSKDGGRLNIGLQIAF